MNPFNLLLEPADILHHYMSVCLMVDIYMVTQVQHFIQEYMVQYGVQYLAQGHWRVSRGGIMELSL